MSPGDETKLSSIADALLSDTVSSAESFQVAKEEARAAEKERALARQRRRQMLESLRASMRQAPSLVADRRATRARFTRLIRDGTAAAVANESKQILREIRTLKHKGELSRAAEVLGASLAEKIKVFVEKKTLLERLESKIDLLSSSTTVKRQQKKKSRQEAENQRSQEVLLEKICVLARTLRGDLVRIMQDLLTTYERFEDRLEADMEEEENARSFFFACISSLEEEARRQVVERCHNTCSRLPVEQRRAVYLRVVEELAKRNKNVATKIHLLARKKARTLLKEGYPERAVSELSAALRLWRDDGETYRLLATALSQKGDERAALVALREALRISPDDLTLRRLVAARWKRLGDEEQAIREYQELLARAPDDHESRRELAKLLFKNNKCDMVVKTLSDYAREFPDDMMCQYWLGASWYWLGRPEIAVSYLRGVVESSVEKHESTHLLVLSYKDLGMLDEAIHLHEEHLRVVPDCSRAHVLQGTLYQTCGELQRTECEYRTAMDRHGKSYGLLMALAKTQIENRQYREAVSTLEEALKQKDNHPEAWLELGKALRLSGEHERAEEILKQTLQADPDNSRARQELSLLYMHEGRWDMAREVLQSFVPAK